MAEFKYIRIVKIMTIFLPGLFATVVFMGNLMDFSSNYEFVKHVLSMDTTFEGNKLMWRSITSSNIWLIAYWALIIAEGIVAILGWITTIKMIRTINMDNATFTNAKKAGYIAFLLALCIWFVGFIIIGSEWFAMWQSKIWNGKQTAMDISEVLIGFLILFSLPEREIE
jgi:predicted small integral membrane protein